MSTPVFDRIGRLVGRITGEVEDENLSDNVALKDEVNTFTASVQTIAAAGLAELRLTDTSASTNEKTFALGSVSNQFAIYSRNDAGTAIENALLIDVNSSAEITSVVLAADGITLNGKIKVTLSNFADDAAAAAGGIEVGELYRNGSVVQVRVS